MDLLHEYYEEFKVVNTVLRLFLLKHSAALFSMPSFMLTVLCILMLKQTRKISRPELVKRLRLMVGDKLLVSTVVRLHHKVLDLC